MENSFHKAIFWSLYEIKNFTKTKPMFLFFWVLSSSGPCRSHSHPTPPLLRQHLRGFKKAGGVLKVTMWDHEMNEWSYTTKARSMLYEHIILTRLGNRFDIQDSWFILQILKPIYSKGEFWNHGWCSKWIYQNKL